VIRDKVWGRGVLLVEKFDSAGKFVGFEKAENLWLTAGINELFGLFSGASVNYFDNTNARIGIGDSATAANAGQTDLQAATNKTYKAMDATYPTAPSGAAQVFRSTFGTGDANYVWNEFVLKQNTSGICLDRGVQNLGTKVAGSTWVATLTISAS